jgi:hypothetical protein
MLNWRKENNIDNLENEDFSWFIREFPFDMDSVDYIGRPGTSLIKSFFNTFEMSSFISFVTKRPFGILLKQSVQQTLLIGMHEK